MAEVTQVPAVGRFISPAVLNLDNMMNNECHPRRQFATLAQAHLTVIDAGPLKRTMVPLVFAPVAFLVFWFLDPGQPTPA